MKYLRFIFGEISSEYKKYPAFTVFIYITVIICFLSVFISLRVFQRDAIIYKNTEKAKATYSDVILDGIEYNNSNKDLSQSIDKIITELNGSISNASFTVDTQDLIVSLEGFGGSSGYTVYVESDDNTIKAGSYFISEGRTFTDKELSQGQNVVIAAEGVLYNGEKPNIGNLIKICGQEYEIIGLGNCLVAPYESVKKSLSSYEENVVFCADKITFDKPLSVSQYADFCNYARILEDLISDYDIAADNNKDIHANQVLISIFIALLAGIIIVVLFKQIIREQLSRIALVKICGCKSYTIFLLFVSQLSIYIVVSFVLACLINKLLEPVMIKFYLEHTISIGLQFEVFTIMFLSPFLFVLPTVVKVSNILPAKLQIRR